MSRLLTQSRFANPDEAFVAIVDAHRDLAPEASAALDARLVLRLANHIGDIAVVKEALAAAREGLADTRAG